MASVTMLRESAGSEGSVNVGPELAGDLSAEQTDRPAGQAQVMASQPEQKSDSGVNNSPSGPDSALAQQQADFILGQSEADPSLRPVVNASSVSTPGLQQGVVPVHLSPGVTILPGVANNAGLITNSVEHEQRRYRKRAVHNEVERRRKDKINAGILRIGELLPCTQQEKQVVSKRGILDKAYDHIVKLSKEHEHMLMNGGSPVQAMEIRRLREQINELTVEKERYEKVLDMHGISVSQDPTLMWKGKTKAVSPAGPYKSVAPLVIRHMKTEGQQVAIGSAGVSPLASGLNTLASSKVGEIPLVQAPNGLQQAVHTGMSGLLMTKPAASSSVVSQQVPVGQTVVNQAGGLVNLVQVPTPAVKVFPSVVGSSAGPGALQVNPTINTANMALVSPLLSAGSGAVLGSQPCASTVQTSVAKVPQNAVQSGMTPAVIPILGSVPNASVGTSHALNTPSSVSPYLIQPQNSLLGQNMLGTNSVLVNTASQVGGVQNPGYVTVTVMPNNMPSVQEVPGNGQPVLMPAGQVGNPGLSANQIQYLPTGIPQNIQGSVNQMSATETIHQNQQFSNMLGTQNVNAVSMLPVSACTNLTNVSQSTAVPRLSTGITNSLTSPVLNNVTKPVTSMVWSTTSVPRSGGPNNIQVPGVNGMQVVAGPTINSSGTLKLPLPSNPNVVPNMTGPMFTILQGPGNQIILMPVVTSAGSGTSLPQALSSSSSDSKKKSSKKSSKKKAPKSAEKGAKATDSSTQSKQKNKVACSTQNGKQTTHAGLVKSSTTVDSQAIMQSGGTTLVNQSPSQATPVMSLPNSSGTTHVNTTATVGTSTVTSTPYLLPHPGMQAQVPHASLPVNIINPTSSMASTLANVSSGSQTVATPSNPSLSAAAGPQVSSGQAPLMFPAVSPLQLPCPVNHTSVVPTPTAFLTNQSSQFNQNLNKLGGGGAVQVPVGGGVQLLSLPSVSNPMVPFNNPLQVNTTQTATVGTSQNTQDILAKAAESIFSAQSPDLSSPSEQPLFSSLQVSQACSTSAPTNSGQQTCNVAMISTNSQNIGVTTSSNSKSQYHILTHAAGNAEHNKRTELADHHPTSHLACRQGRETAPQSLGTSMPFMGNKQHHIGLQGNALSFSGAQNSGVVELSNVNSQVTDSAAMQQQRHSSGHHVGLPKQVSTPHTAVCPVPMPSGKSRTKAKAKPSEGSKAKAKERKGKSAGSNKSQAKGNSTSLTSTCKGGIAPSVSAASEGTVTTSKDSRSTDMQGLSQANVSAIGSNSNNSVREQTSAVFSTNAPVGLIPSPVPIPAQLSKTATPISSVVTQAQGSAGTPSQGRTVVQPRTPTKNSRLSYSAEALIGNTASGPPPGQETPQSNAEKTVPSPHGTPKRPPNSQYNNLRPEATIARSVIYSPEVQSGKTPGQTHAQNVTNPVEGQGRDPVPSSQAGGFLYVPWLNRPTTTNHGNQASTRPSSSSTTSTVNAKSSAGTRPPPVPPAVTSTVQKSPTFSFFPLQPDLFNQTPQAAGYFPPPTASSKSSKTSMPPPNITPTSHLIQNKDISSIRPADSADRVGPQSAAGRWDGRNISSLLSPRLHPHSHQHSRSEQNTSPATSDASRLLTGSKSHGSIPATGASTVSWGNQGLSQRIQNQTNSTIESQKSQQPVGREGGPMRQLNSVDCRTSSNPSTQLMASVQQQRTVETNDQRVPAVPRRGGESRVNTHSGRSEQMEPPQRQDRPRPSPQGTVGRQGPAKTRNNPWQGDQQSPAQANGHEVATSQTSPRLPVQSPQRTHADTLSGGRVVQQAGRPDTAQNMAGRQIQITEQQASSPRTATANVTRNPQSFVATLGHPTNNNSIDRSPRHHNGPMSVEPESPSFSNQRPSSGESQAARKNKRQREAEEQQPKRLKPTDNNQTMRSSQPVSEGNNSRQKNSERPMTWTIVHREAAGTQAGSHHIVPQPMQDLNGVRTSASDVNHGQVVNGHGREHLPPPHPPRLATSHDFFNPAFNIHPRGQDMHRHNIQPRAPFPGPDFQRDGRPHGTAPSTQHNPQSNLNTSASFLPGMPTPASEASRPHSRAHEVSQFYTNFNPPKQVHGDVPLPTYLPNQVLASQPPRLPEGRAEIATPFNPFSPPRPAGLPLNFSQNFPVVPDGNIPRTTFNLPPAVTSGPPANTLVNSLPPPPPPITPHVPNFGMFPEVPHNVAGPQNDNAAALGVPQLPFHTSPMLSQAHGDPHHPGLRTGPLIGARAKESFMHSAMSIQNILGKGQHPPLEDPAAMNHGIGAGMGPSYHTSAFSNAVHAFNFPPP
ncbi:basic helix-loop-helix domain-containing protein USF3-like [Branchiostoma floridae]|uniref:Basic helix-loop-helix domain-containing protein USF3-like n=1 Tax=Branchiostoma floridae TaxID=7739 RepID=A0A9J7M1U0_BRAFL|nr:basic helix-loop-helix domain-containing protein USF3-like [Branchiostoma floridae]